MPPAPGVETARRPVRRRGHRQLARRFARQRVDVHDRRGRKRHRPSRNAAVICARSSPGRRRRDQPVTPSRPRRRPVASRTRRRARRRSNSGEVEVPDRAALAATLTRSLSGRGGEGLGIDDLEHVGSTWLAARPAAHVASLPSPAMRRPSKVRHRGPPSSAASHLPGLGSRNLEQRRSQHLLGARGELRRERRGGADDEASAGLSQAGVEHGLQVEGRRHEDARAGTPSSAAATSAG